MVAFSGPKGDYGHDRLRTDFGCIVAAPTVFVYSCCSYPWVLGSSHWVARVLWLTKYMRPFVSTRFSTMTTGPRHFHRTRGEARIVEHCIHFLRTSRPRQILSNFRIFFAHWISRRLYSEFWKSKSNSGTDTWRRNKISLSANKPWIVPGEAMRTDARAGLPPHGFRPRSIWRGNEGQFSLVRQTKCGVRLCGAKVVQL